MTDDTPRKTLKIHEALLRQLKPFADHIAGLQTDPAFQRAIDELEQTQSLLRASHGPFEDLRRNLLLADIPHLAPQLEAIRSLGIDLERQFRLPKALEIPKLLHDLEIDQTTRVLAHYREHAAEIRHALESFTTPWLDIRGQVQSLAGFAELHEIGHLLGSMSVFDVGVATRLRDHLGDWRQPIDWPSEILTDPLARSDFYVDRGLDPALANFPASAFDQLTTTAGIKRSAPPLISAYDYVPEQIRDDEEAGFERNNFAHDRLQRFETHVRSFIDKEMTAAIGERWMKHRVPGDIRREWREKRDRALGDGEAKQRLIAYADFTDYISIIVRRDNWEQVFRQYFRRRALVQESFQRLYPIRVCTMHARVITQDDELFLMAETVRLLKAMGIKT